MAGTAIRARTSHRNISPKYDVILSPAQCLGPLLAEYASYRIYEHPCGAEAVYAGWHLTTFRTYAEALAFAMNCAKAAEAPAHV